MDPTDELLNRARRRVNLKMGFFVHATVFVLVNLGLAGISLVQGRHWFIAPLAGWGLGLAIHGIVTLAALRGDGLRERLLKSEIDRLQQRQGR
jgi:hypothetical protein